MNPSVAPVPILSPAAPLFPLRVAVVDVGSNALRFLAAEFADRSTWAELAYDRVAVRLGHDAFLTGRLNKDAMSEAVKAFGTFRQKLDALKITHYRAVATSAVRDSKNGAELIERIAEEAGMRLETISGREEARLVWLAIRSRVPLTDQLWVLADLGGGSLEITLADAEAIRWTESHPMGTVRLLEELEEAGDLPPEDLRKLLEEYTARLRLPRTDEAVQPAGIIATGGNAEALLELAVPDRAADRVGELPLAELDQWIERLAHLSPKQRVARLGLRPDRADVILPAAITYRRVALLAGADRILVPGVGVKEGLLLDLVDDLAMHRAHEQQQDREAFAGSLALGRRYSFDEAHARQVARLTLSLFTQLEPLHELSAADRRILLAAALLHDIGQFVSYRKHHKHSHYLISFSELETFTPREIPLIAAVARYHRRADPSTDHPEFADLSEENRDRVRKMASLLRIADALDRDHRQQVEDVQAALRDDRVELELQSAEPVLLERWALRKKSELFEQTFGRSVRLAEAK